MQKTKKAGQAGCELNYIALKVMLGVSFLVQNHLYQYNVFAVCLLKGNTTSLIG